MTEEQIRKLIADAQAANNKALEERYKAQLDALKAELAAANKPTADALAALTEQVKKLGEAKPEPKPEDKPDPTKKPDPVADAITAALKPLQEQLASLVTQVKPAIEEAAASKQQAASLKLVGETVAKKAPGLKDKKALLNRIAALNPKDEAAVVAALEAERQAALELGADVKAFGADPAKEGAKPTPEAGSKEAKKAELIQSIKNAGTGIV